MIWYKKVILVSNIEFKMKIGGRGVVRKGEKFFEMYGIDFCLFVISLFVKLVNLVVILDYLFKIVVVLF